MRRAAALSILAAAALVGNAGAQPPPDDPIGALLDAPTHPTAQDLDEPDVAGQKIAPEPAPEPRPAAPRETLGPVPAPAEIPYAPSPRSQLTGPVRLDETGKTPDGPPSIRDLSYDSRLRASFASAEGFQGPLEGGWTVGSPSAGDLYALQLVDRRDRLEGVWRDLRRVGALNASGLVDDIQRTGDDLTLSFAAARLVLHVAPDGRWTGQLTEGGQTRPVALRRTGL